MSKLFKEDDIEHISSNFVRHIFNAIIFDQHGILYSLDFDKTNTSGINIIDEEFLTSYSLITKLTQVLHGKPFQETIPDIEYLSGTSGALHLYALPLNSQNSITKMGIMLSHWVPLVDNNYDNKRLQSLLLGLAHVTEVIIDPEADGYDIYKPLMTRIGRTIGAKLAVLYKLEFDNTPIMKYELPPGSSDHFLLHTQDINLERLRTEKVIKDWPLEGCIAIPITIDYLWGFVLTQKTEEPWSDVEIYTIYYLCKIITIMASRANTARALQESESRYRSLLENLPDMVFTMNIDGYFTFGNSVCTKLTGYPISNLIKMNINNLIAPEYIPLIYENISKRISGEDLLPYEIDLINTAGLRVPVELHATHSKNTRGQITEIIGVVRDLSERTRLQEELVASELKYRTYIENTPNVIIVMDNSGRINFVNQKAEALIEYPPEQILNRHFSDFVAQDERDSVISNFYARLDGIKMNSLYETKVISAQSRIIPVEIRPNVLYDAHNKVSGLLCIVSDITNEKRTKEKLKYLSEHDALTGIYNRTRFQEMISKLQENELCPAGIVMCDINGLKLINDTLGHQAGDRLIQTVSNILQNLSKPSFYPARIGGDEFAVILPGVSQIEMDQFIQSLHHKISNFNQHTDGIFLSLAVGNCIRHSPRQTMDMVIRTADNSMYRSKLLEQMSTRNTIIRTLTSALTMRDHMTEEHATRLKHLACGFGRRMNLNDEDLDNLSLLAVTHDIGKIGIPDEILFKNGSLENDEWEIMRSHSEIGYRIAVESRELSGIAEYILYHHEHWNGEGYPMKLTGPQIPLICRILAIIDAHDAMINDRPYRSAMSKKEAFDQLVVDKGIKFDPDILQEYIKYLIELGESE